MLGIIPRVPSHQMPDFIRYYNRESNKIEDWIVPEFEEEFKVSYCPNVICSQKYIEELMFSGFGISQRDTEFRKQYETVIEETIGDENLVLAFINENVGYGAYAAKNFQPGEFIVKYGGRLTAEGMPINTHSM